MPSIIVRRDQIAPSLWEIETATGLIKYESIAYAHDSEEQKTFKGVGRAEAKRLHRVHQTEFEDATPSSTSDKNKTLGELRDEAWAHYQSLIDVENESNEQAPVSAGQLRNHKTAWEKRISPFRINGRSIDQLKIGEFDKPVARKFLTYLRIEHKAIASQTRNGTVSALRKVLRYARDDGAMTVDPFHGIPTGEFPAQKPRKGWVAKVFTEAERDLVIEAAQSETFVAATPDVLLTNAVIFTAVTGARLAEVLGVRWGSVDADGELVRVQLREQRIRHKADEPAATKPFMKNGEIAIRPTMSSLALSEAVRRQVDHELGKDRGANSDLIFTDALGIPIRHDQLKQAVRRACRLAGLGDYGPQVLRRTTATTLAQLGVSSTNGAALMGHSVDTFTKVYVQPIIEGKALTEAETLLYGKEAT